MDNSQIPNIFEFQDYRVFLSHYYRARKLIRSNYSYTVFARYAGLTKPHLIQIVQGKRNLSQNRILKMGEACHLEGDALKYFFFLVHFNQVEDVNTKEQFRVILESIRNGESQVEALAA